jgi:sec-independent protein translocase protein TatA
MFGLQPIHLLFVAVVALVIFGPRRLPKLGHWLGKTFQEFRNGAKQMAEQINEESAPQPATETRSNTQRASPSSSVSLQQPDTTGGSCPSCKASNPSGSKFCGQCGAQLT